MDMSKLAKVTEAMKKQSEAARVVKTAEEAREFTADDPLGHTWNVGDKYYVFFFRGDLQRTKITK